MNQPEQSKLFDMPPAWTELWKGMPEFRQEDIEPWRKLIVNFASPEDFQAFAKLIGQRLTNQTRYIWFPHVERQRPGDNRYASRTAVGPRWPIYIPSKGRADTRLTMKALDRIAVPYRVVIEAPEYDAYATTIPEDRLLVLPFVGRGLTAARNWIWDHARDSGAERYWTFDDNIKDFIRLHQNVKTPVADGAMLRAIEDFVDRYENVTIAGCNYRVFAAQRSPISPITLNTRVYSNMLIQTRATDSAGDEWRNECFYNDDTDLCLRVLKAGQCTVLFNAFLIDKATTMSIKGGNTPIYQGNGRYDMARELAEKHPDVVTITEKWGRPQHHVDYSPFRRNKLHVRADATIPDSDDYEIELLRLNDR